MEKKFLLKFMTKRSKTTFSAVTVLSLGTSLLALAPVNALAVAFTGSQTNLTEWTYNLTYDPLDNYSIYQNSTTITLTGLHGVTSATGPISTDFSSSFLNGINLNWTAAVLNGGTTVEWTHVGAGTGNFSIPKHAYGFKVFAAGALNGTVSLATDGFSRDTSNSLPDGTFDIDISGMVSGPVRSPVPEPASLLLFGTGLVGLVGFGSKMKK